MPGGEERILRRRIRSVESTKKITRAFELIAASQIVRAMGRIAGSRPYVEGIREVLAVTAAEVHGTSRVLGGDSEPQQRLLVIIVADRGLCGGYNSIALRTAERVMRDGQSQGATYRVMAVGKKAQNYFRFRDRPLERCFMGMSDRPTYADARAVAAEVAAPLIAGEVDAVDLISWRFRSAGSQAIEVKRILPLSSEDPPSADEDGAPASSEEKATGFFDFEPEPEQLLELLVPQYTEAVLYEALLEASASEHAARQRAMAAATENAEEFITTLRRQMNRVRQEAITTEIMEIVSGAEALRHAGAETYIDINFENLKEQIA